MNINNKNGNNNFPRIVVLKCWMNVDQTMNWKIDFYRRYFVDILDMTRKDIEYWWFAKISGIYQFGFNKSVKKIECEVTRGVAEEACQNMGDI